jgi:hypothetical protein
MLHGEMVGLRAAAARFSAAELATGEPPVRSSTPAKVKSERNLNMR